MAEAGTPPVRKTISNTVNSVDDQSRVLEFVGTTEAQDRDGEVIKASAWQVDKYVKNPVVQWAHDYTKPPIGRTVSISLRGTATVFAIEFADRETYEFADTIFRLCKGGFLSATSVGFIPLESKTGKKESDARRTYTKVELLEISIVPVPSNPEALATARDTGVITVKEFKNFYPDLPVVGTTIATDLTVKSLATDIATAEIVDMTDQKKPVSQETIRDEIDYLKSMVAKVGLTEENKAELKRIAGGDTPEFDTKGLKSVMKMIDEHHDIHQKWYEGCKKAFDMMDMENDQDPDDKAAPVEAVDLTPYIQQAIQRQLKSEEM